MFIQFNKITLSAQGTSAEPTGRDDVYEYPLPSDMSHLSLAECSSLVLVSGEKGFKIAQSSEAKEERRSREFSALKAYALAQVDLWRYKELQKGVDFVFPDGVKDNIQTRSELDLVTVQGKALEAMISKQIGDGGYIGEFRAKSNVTRTLDADQMCSMGLTVSGAVSALYQASWQYKDIIREKNSSVELRSYMEEIGIPI